MPILLAAPAVDSTALPVRRAWRCHRSVLRPADAAHQSHGSQRTRNWIAACLVTLGTTWPGFTAADVFREYCHFGFCYVGLNDEDAVAFTQSVPPGLPWYYRQMTPLSQSDSAARSFCITQFSQWGYTFHHHAVDTYAEDVQGFPFTFLRVRCSSSAPYVDTYTWSFPIAARCPLGWSGYSGFHDSASPYSFAYPYNFGTSDQPDVARWCQKQCGFDESMGNSGVCEKRTNLGPPPQNACAGNPINAAAGNKHQYEVDLAAVNGPFKFGRSYNSWDGRNLYESLSRSMGRSWLHDFDRVINVVRYATNERAFSYRGNGRTYSATAPRNANVFAADQSFSNQHLQRVPDGLGSHTWKLSGTEANEIEIYLTDGRLSQLLYPTGLVLRMVHGNGSVGSPLNLLVEVQDSYGRVWRLTYDSKRRVNGLIDLAGLNTAYTYDDANELLTSVSFPAATGTHVRTYVYAEPAFDGGNSRPRLLTGIVDEKNQRFSTYQYGTGAAATGSEHAGGANRVTLGYASGSVAITDARNSVRTVGLSQTGGRWLPTSQSQPAGSGCGPSSSAITYDAQANVSSRTDFNNNKICYAYDLSRNLETQRVEGLTAAAVCSTALSSPPTGARVITTQWHPDWRLETRIAEPKKLTTITYNGQGATCAPSTVLVDGKPPAVICTRTEQATTDETGASGFAATVTGTARTWRYTYTTYGRVLTATDPNNRVTTTSYHPDNDPDLGKRGNVASITNAANHTTYLTDYNPHGQPTRMVDPNGVVTVLTYDPRMRLTSRTVGNEATVFGYDPVGQMTSVNLPDGARLTYTYDAAHRLTAINDHKGNRIDYTLDAMGNRINEQMKDPGGVLVGNISRVIDALNRVQQVTGAMQ